MDGYVRAAVARLLFDGLPLLRSLQDRRSPIILPPPFSTSMLVRRSTYFNNMFLAWTDRILAPHIGHLYTLVLTDILKRWQVLRGKKAILCTGTDEHGMKVGQHRSY